MNTLIPMQILKYEWRSKWLKTTLVLQEFFFVRDVLKTLSTVER